MATEQHTPGRHARRRLAWTLVVCSLLLASREPAHGEPRYPWLGTRAPVERLDARFPAPPGFRRVPAAPDSFAAWLRGLPIKAPGTPVHLHDGRPKPRQDVHAAVIDIDTGARDLQQCADSVMRLRAEYLFSRGRIAAIAFDFSSGERVPFSRWARGERPRVTGNRVHWAAGGPPDATHASLRRYLDLVFAYAGTYSLARELVAVPIDELAIGDVFIKGGFPGHAVIVVDVVINTAGERRFLLAQSFMPAQDMHVLVDPAAHDGSPWYRLDFGPELRTPEWTFARASLRRFADPR